MLVFGRRGPLSRDGVKVSGGGMKEIGESIHVKIVDEQTISEIETIWAKDVGGFISPTAHECLQSNYQWSHKVWCKGWGQG